MVKLVLIFGVILITEGYYQDIIAPPPPPPTKFNPRDRIPPHKVARWTETPLIPIFYSYLIFIL